MKEICKNCTPPKKRTAILWLCVDEMRVYVRVYLLTRGFTDFKCVSM